MRERVDRQRELGERVGRYRGGRESVGEILRGERENVRGGKELEGEEKERGDRVGGRDL